MASRDFSTTFCDFRPNFLQISHFEKETPIGKICLLTMLLSMPKNIRRKNTIEIQTPSRELTHPTPPLEVPKIIILKSVLGCDMRQFPGGFKKPRTQMIQMIHIFEDLTHEIQPPQKN